MDSLLRSCAAPEAAFSKHSGGTTGLARLTASRWTHNLVLGFPLLCFHLSFTGSCEAPHTACGPSLGYSCWLARLCFHLSATTSLAQLTAPRWTGRLALGLPLLCSNLSVTSSCAAPHTACSIHWAKLRTPHAAIHWAPTAGSPGSVPIFLSQPALHV